MCRKCATVKVERLPALCEQKSAAVYQYVYDSYYGAGQSVYAALR